MTAQSKSPRIENPAHLDLVRLLPCCAPSIGNPSADQHWGIICAHHRMGAGMARKSGDDETLPLCVRHHDDFHFARGVFKNWPRARRREWQTEMIEQTRAAVAALDMFTPDAIPATGEFEGVF